LYSDTDLAALMAAARSLIPPLRAATYETFIGLLSVTGLFSRVQSPCASVIL